MATTDRNRAPVLNILLRSIQVACGNKARFSTALALPTLLLVTIWATNWLFFEPAKDLTAWVVWSVYKIAFVIFAVACHRLVLVEAATSTFQFSFGVREVKFVSWAVAVYGIFYFIAAVPITVVMNLSTTSDALDSPEFFYYAQLLSSIPATYILARLCLVFPATAIDMKYGLSWSWAQTRGNGWRIFVIIGLYPWLISTVIWLVSRDEPTLIEQVFTALLYYVGLALEVFALSLTYKYMVAVDEPSTLNA